MGRIWHERACARKRGFLVRRRKSWPDLRDRSSRQKLEVPYDETCKVAAAQVAIDFEETPEQHIIVRVSGDRRCSASGKCEPQIVTRFQQSLFETVRIGRYAWSKRAWIRRSYAGNLRLGRPGPRPPGRSDRVRQQDLVEDVDEDVEHGAGQTAGRDRARRPSRAANADSLTPLPAMRICSSSRKLREAVESIEEHRDCPRVVSSRRIDHRVEVRRRQPGPPDRPTASWKPKYSLSAASVGGRPDLAIDDQVPDLMGDDVEIQAERDGFPTFARVRAELDEIRSRPGRCRTRAGA